jgi:hypothetical protein
LIQYLPVGPAAIIMPEELVSCSQHSPKEFIDCRAWQRSPDPPSQSLIFSLALKSTRKVRNIMFEQTCNIILRRESMDDDTRYAESENASDHTSEAGHLLARINSMSMRKRNIRQSIEITDPMRRRSNLQSSCALSIERSRSVSEIAHLTSIERAIGD